MNDSNETRMIFYADKLQRGIAAAAQHIQKLAQSHTRLANRCAELEAELQVYKRKEAIRGIVSCGRIKSDYAEQARVDAKLQGLSIRAGDPFCLGAIADSTDNSDGDPNGLG